MTIKKQWMLVLITCAILTVFINSIVLSSLINKYFVNYTKENYDKNLDQIIEYSTMVLNQDNYTKEQIVSQLEAYLDDPILGIKIYDINSNLLAEVSNKNNEGHGVMGKIMGAVSKETDSIDVYSSEVLVGKINITKSNIEINSSSTGMFKAALILYSLLSFGIVLIVIITVGIVTSKKMSKDLMNTASQALSIDLGNQINIKPSKVKEIRVIQQSLETLQARLKLKQTSRKELLDEMVHQTRTPLTILKTHLEGFQDGLINLSPEEIVTCEVQIENITEIILNMSNLLDAGKEVDILKIEEFDLNNMLKQIVGGLKVQFNKKKIDISILNHEKLFVKTDKYKLSQCIYNILTNAYKFTDSNGKVSVDYKKQDEEVLIEITDTGIGIEKENLEHIFDAYYRGNNANNTKGEGLGLYIVKENLEKISGKIEVNSLKGKGSKFTMRIKKIL